MHILSPVATTLFLKKRKEKRKYVARPGIEPRTLTYKSGALLPYAARLHDNGAVHNIYCECWPPCDHGRVSESENVTVLPHSPSRPAPPPPFLPFSVSKTQISSIWKEIHFEKCPGICGYQYLMGIPI